jgi:hypothetical protein
MNISDIHSRIHLISISIILLLNILRCGTEPILKDHPLKSDEPDCTCGDEVIVNGYKINFDFEFEPEGFAEYLFMDQNEGTEIQVIMDYSFLVKGASWEGLIFKTEYDQGKFLNKKFKIKNNHLKSARLV